MHKDVLHDEGFSMKRLFCSAVAFALAAPVFAQEPAQVPSATGIPISFIQNSENCAPVMIEADTGGGGLLTGDKGFANFIGYITNPTKAIDPRSLTQIMPIYDYASLGAVTHTTRGVGPLPPRNVTLVPAGEVNIIGPAISLAITDRFNIGITSGGPALTSYPGRHQGWLDIGGYAQYTLIRDVPNQFIGTVGMTWTAPDGTHSLFQGSPPAYLGTYGTVGKELGDWHVLTTVGFEFPAGSGTVTKDTFYGTVHVDRRCFGWLYPLVEFNWAATTANVVLDRPVLAHLLGFDDFSANGNIITVAPGFNAVIVPDKLEIGAAYQTPIASQNNLHFNSFLVKMVLRF